MDEAHLSELLAGHLPSRGVAGGLAVALRSMVLDSRLLPGSRLPAERALAARLGVSRKTVTTAYAALRAEGYLVSRRGSGTFADLPSAETLTRPDEDRSPAAPGLIDLTVAALPAPVQLDQLAARAARDLRGQLAGSGLEPAGLAPLRDGIADRYRARGIPTTAEEIIVSSGALHAWDMLLRALVKPGGVVVTEQPTYPAIIDAALAHRARIFPLPLSSDGWQMEALRRTRDAVLVHVTFDGQNPTGCWAGDATREAVVDGFGRDSIVVVDETMRDYCHLTGPIGESAGIFQPRRHGPTVVAVGSLSKSFWAGLRVGWLRAPAPLVRRLTAVRSGQDLAPPVLEQLLAARLLHERTAILPPRRAIVGQRRLALLTALERDAPGWRVAAPAGGLHAWVDLGDRSSTRLAHAARRHGVRITPGPRFTITGSHDQFIRIPFVRPSDVLEDAVRRLVLASEHLPPPRPQSHQSADDAWAV